MMDFLLPSPEIKDIVRKELSLDEQRVKETVNGIKEWMQRQPHLPKHYDDERLERWLLRCKNNMEKTKQTIDLYYTFKTITPEIMTGWDVEDTSLNSLKNVCYGFPMPKLTSDYDRVCIAGLFTTESEALLDWAMYKLLIMSHEIRMCEDYYNKDIGIFDMKNFTLAHASKFNLTGLRKMAVCCQRAYCTRIRSIHFINTPHYASTLINLIKKLVKNKIADRIYVHNTDLEELHKLVPKSCLPVELGGNCGTIKEHFSVWENKLRSYGEWFSKQEKLRTDESKRPNGQINSDEMFGFEGSFRQLSID